jgi:excisionase family DNA binding protein
MLTVPEAAKRTGRNPETIRRWIREGEFRASKVGMQHVIEEHDLHDDPCLLAAVVAVGGV